MNDRYLLNIEISDMRDESILKKARMTLLDHLLVSLEFAQYIYNKTNTNQVLVSLDVSIYLPETLLLTQKNNMGIIGNYIIM